MVENRDMHGKWCCTVSSMSTIQPVKIPGTEFSCQSILIYGSKSAGSAQGRCINHCTKGCKHSKVDQESAPVYGSHDFLGQTPILVAKCCLKIYIYIYIFMMTFIVKLGTQIHNINMRSSKPIIKSDA
jgi:hypothetical protein